MYTTNFYRNRLILLFLFWWRQMPVKVIVLLLIVQAWTNRAFWIPLHTDITKKNFLRHKYSLLQIQPIGVLRFSMPFRVLHRLVETKVISDSDSTNRLQIWFAEILANAILLLKFANFTKLVGRSLKPHQSMVYILQHS